MLCTLLWLITSLVELLVCAFKVCFAYSRRILQCFMPAETRSVKDDIILITGAAHGIGKQLSLQYGRLGATIICVDINEKGNLETVAELKRQGVKAYQFCCDITNRSNVLALRDDIEKSIGYVTILVNNAGIFVAKKFLDHSPGVVQRILDVNVLSHFWTLQAFLPAMMKRKSGHVVALSSITGLSGIPNMVPYSASKFAVRGMMESLKEELRQDDYSNIHFTTIYPFVVDTGMVKNPVFNSPTLLPQLKAEDVAAVIISAQRRNISHISIPSYAYNGCNALQMVPDEARDVIYDYVNTRVDPDND